MEELGLRDCVGDFDCVGLIVWLVDFVRDDDDVADQVNDARADAEGLPVVELLTDLVRLGDVLGVPVGERVIVGLTVPVVLIVRLADPVREGVGVADQV